MEKKFIEIDLNQEQKEAILAYASFFLMDEITKNDLLNKRKKWIRFNPNYISNIIGELVYQFNQCKNDYLFFQLDELISHLEMFEKRP